MSASLSRAHTRAQGHAHRCTGGVYHLAVSSILLAACGRPHTGAVVPDSARVAGETAGSLPSSPGVMARIAGALGLHRDAPDASAYEGHDAHDIPHYATRDFSAEEAEVLRRAYGIEDPHRLYVSDSTEEGILKYDTQVKRCRTCLVNSHRVGFVSVRQPGESWEQAERRVRATPARQFTGYQHPASRGIADMDPEVQPVVQRMLADAHAAGFTVQVSATYRSPQREAFLMAEGSGRTHTLTSAHSYGRALDVVIDDGNRGRPRTKADWIAFRRWVSRYRTANGEYFHILGAPDHTWDWGHVELPTQHVGFRTIEDAIARGRACLAPDATIPCDFSPHLPGDPVR
jgi:hypothetical protein